MPGRLRFEVAIRTDQGKLRPNNEDAFAHVVLEGGLLLIVTDGLGGHQGGEVAARLAVEAVAHYFNHHTVTDAAAQLRTALAQADRLIQSRAISEPSLKGMATTCALLLVADEALHLAHLGDSRIYRLRDQTLTRLTQDHTLVQQLLDAGQLQPDDVAKHPERNVVTRVLGVAGMAEPEVQTTAAQPQHQDVYLLCSDGLPAMLSDAHICELLCGHGTVDTASDALIAAALAAGGDDNVTVIVCRVLREN